MRLRRAAIARGRSEENGGGKCDVDKRHSNRNPALDMRDRTVETATPLFEEFPLVVKERDG